MTDERQTRRVPFLNQEGRLPLAYLPGEASEIIEARDTAVSSASTASAAAADSATVKAELEAIFAGGTEAVNDAAVSTFVGSKGTATNAALSSSFVSSDVVIPDAVGEYQWVYPQVVYDEARGRTLVCGISSDIGDGNAWATLSEINHATNERRSARLWQVLADDHNVPSLVLLPNGAVFVQGTNHNGDALIRYGVSNAAGDLDSIVTNTTSVTWPVSYTQPIIVSESSTGCVVWVMARIMRYQHDAWAWDWVPLTVTYATKGVTRGTTVRGFTGNMDDQTYVATVWDPAKQVMRAAAYYNPAVGFCPIWAFEIDPATGDVTSLAEPGFSANVKTSTNTPIHLPDRVPLLADDPAVGRRMFQPRPGPAPWGVLYAEWPDGEPQNAVYRLHTPSGSGGLSTKAGWASAPDAPLFDALTTGFSFEWNGTITETPPSSGVELVRRLTAVPERQFYVRVTNTGAVEVFRFTAGQEANAWITTQTIPNFMGRDLRVRVVFVNEGGTYFFRRYYWENDAWVELDSAQSAGPSDLYDTTAPLIIGPSAGSQQTGLLTSYTKLTNGTGGVVSEINWAVQADGATTATDGQGNTFTLNGDATLVTSGDSVTIGNTGPRVGYTWSANYVGGGGFTDPCNADDPVFITERSADDTESTLSYVFMEQDGPRKVERVVSADYLARPFGPVNGGPIRCILSEFTFYDETFTNYQGFMRAI